ncbi:MAG TPA: formyltetrahydrofolate deformylase [Porticoccaceae bacterium]|nr:formyltetrahydrofolate deformylase [Porticoccaceae bacterium]
MATRSYRLIISCPDKVGIVAAVSNFIAGEGGLISEANHYLDPDTSWFFTRQVIDASTLPYDIDEFRRRFSAIAADFSMEWRVRDTDIPYRVLLMASKQAHCLSDILYRWRSKEMTFEIPAVICNHDELRGYVEWHGLPFHHIPSGDKKDHFRAVGKLFEEISPDVIVLARYMQILPPKICAQYAGQIINIHHSFLPAFAGARPYHQAAERGVKLIGATCHYVTDELDAGPIIDQDVARISHHDSIDDMVRIGKDIEKIVLARGLRYHLEDRVLIHGNKTIVFE